MHQICSHIVRCIWWCHWFRVSPSPCLWGNPDNRRLHHQHRRNDASNNLKILSLCGPEAEVSFSDAVRQFRRSDGHPTEISVVVHRRQLPSLFVPLYKILDTAGRGTGWGLLDRWPPEGNQEGQVPTGTLNLKIPATGQDIRSISRETSGPPVIQPSSPAPSFYYLSRPFLSDKLKTGK